MIIRFAKKSDLERIHVLDRESVKFHLKFDRKFYSITSKEWKIKRQEHTKALGKPDNVFLVAESEGEIAGYVLGYVEKRGKHSIGVIRELIVSEKNRQKGIASLLMRRIISFFKKKNCTSLELIVRVENLAAIALYEKFGFKKKEHKMALKLKRK